jgi:hypothetical protein
MMMMMHAQTDFSNLNSFANQQIMQARDTSLPVQPGPEFQEPVQQLLVGRCA